MMLRLPLEDGLPLSDRAWKLTRPHASSNGAPPPAWSGASAIGEQQRKAEPVGRFVFFFFYEGFMIRV